MDASASIRASGTRLDLRSDPPITLRATPDAVYLVGSAAGPVGGDMLALDVTVEAGASLCVRSAAAAIHHPSPHPAPSTFEFDIAVHAGSSLSWQPEPAVFIDGCDHRITTRISLADDATLVWREEYVLGRHHEPAGSVLSRLVVDRGTTPLIRSELQLGPQWPGAQGPAGAGDARAAGSLLVVGRPATLFDCPTDDFKGRAAVIPLADDVTVVTVLADRSSDVSALFERLLDVDLPADASPANPTDLASIRAQPV